MSIAGSIPLHELGTPSTIEFVAEVSGVFEGGADPEFVVVLGDAPGFFGSGTNVGGNLWHVTHTAEISHDIPFVTFRLLSPGVIDQPTPRAKIATVLYTYTPLGGPGPTTVGLWPLRQRQSLIGSGSWPLRQRQAGAHSGSWALRQRQTGA